MKSVKMFILESCPYCNQARKWMQELRQENPQYSDVKIEMIDEAIRPDIANEYDYYYVPTYYIDDEKVHEGVANKEIIRQVFEKALE